MSKEYYYIRRQSAGCDYSIGCGVSIGRISASSKEEAIERIIGLSAEWEKEYRAAVKNGKDAEDYYSDLIASTGLYTVSPNKENSIFHAQLLEVVSDTDILPILEAKLLEISSLKDSLLKEEQEKFERKQYEKLKKKFDKK